MDPRDRNPSGSADFDAIDRSEFFYIETMPSNIIMYGELQYSNINKGHFKNFIKFFSANGKQPKYIHVHNCIPCLNYIIQLIE